MNTSPLLLPHIVAGVIGFLSGVAALFLRKGFRPHRVAGDVFSISMLVMSGCGAYMATFVSPLKINVIAGVLTFCLVGTGWLTVLRKEGETGRLEYPLLLAAVLNGAACLFFAWEAANTATGMEDGSPTGAYLAFGVIALLGAAGDVRLLIRRGISGAQRIARHLWRMCLALLLTTVSLFVGTPHTLLVPPALSNPWARVTPIIIVA
jgi:hypothetical protein